MTAESTVLGGRQAAEAMMTDSCRVTRPGTGPPVRDPETGRLVPPAPVMVYEGRCRVRAENVSVAEVEAGERRVGLVRFAVSLPVAAETAAVGRGHTVEVLSSLLDPGLVGRRFTVSSGFAGSQITARRFPVEEAQ